MGADKWRARSHDAGDRVIGHGQIDDVARATGRADPGFGDGRGRARGRHPIGWERGGVAALERGERGAGGRRFRVRGGHAQHRRIRRRGDIPDRRQRGGGGIARDRALRAPAHDTAASSATATARVSRTSMPIIGISDCRFQIEDCVSDCRFHIELIIQSQSSI